MAINFFTLPTQPTDTQIISAVQARKNFGELIDIVDYKGQSVIIQRAGKPKVAVIPLSDFEIVKEQKVKAKQKFFAMSKEFAESFKNLNKKEKQALINQAIVATRKNK
ncbi:MAG: type II toxin-antitoxin system Phd/YefM family antitoxin [Patescibacteria group bacterium]